MDFDAQSFGERLRVERERLQLSQQAAATAGGVRREMWGKYERGLAEPGVKVIAGMASLGADVLYLFCGRREVQLEEGLGLVSPVGLGHLVLQLKLEFERQGIKPDMYAHGRGGDEAEATYLARIVTLAGQLYNELQTLPRSERDDRPLMVRSAALTEWSSLKTRREVASDQEPPPA